MMMMDGNHTTSHQEAFSILFSVPHNLNKHFSFRLLSTAEASVIHLINPELGGQKHLLRAS